MILEPFFPLRICNILVSNLCSTFVQFGCCGVKNYTDWYEVFPRTKAIPHSCCHDLPLDESCVPAKLTKVPGCYSRFSQFVQTKTLTLAVIVLSVGILQVSYMLIRPIGSIRGKTLRSFPNIFHFSYADSFLQSGKRNNVISSWQTWLLPTMMSHN